MEHGRIRLSALATVLACVLVAVPVRAENTAAQKASAQALFDEAIRLMKLGYFGDACPKLETSQRLDPGVGTLLYLAECYEKIGRSASAWATFREAASAAESAGQPKRVKVAHERAARLEKELAYLTLEVAPETLGLPGLVIRRDGIDAGHDIVGVAVPLDPGTVMIQASAPGYQRFSLIVSIAAATRQSVLVPALVKLPPPRPPFVDNAAAPPVAPTPVPVPPPAPVARPNPGGTQRWVGISLGALGLVGAGIGTYFGLRAIDQDGQADAGSCDESICQEAADLEHAEAANRAAVSANVAFALAGSLVAAGVVVYLTAPSASRESALRLTPRLGPGFAGVGVEGSL